MKTYIYVTSSTENKINILSLDKSTGEISKISELKIPGKPAPLALSVSKRFLYIGRRGIPDIACYKIDQSDGSLIHIGENAKLPSDPNCLWSDRKGNFLFSSYYEGKACAVHKLNADGSVEQNPIEWISTAKGAHSMQADPSINTFLSLIYLAEMAQIKFGNSYLMSIMENYHLMFLPNFLLMKNWDLGTTSFIQKCP